jgi:glycosyltransferase involved in cell wall biosynthesis
VIVPVFNGERLIGDALRSIRAQTRPVDEIVVVDDGSTDGTAAEVTGLGVPGLVLLRQENRGPSAARNRGIAAATGDLITFLDADDEWRPDKLAIQLPLLERQEVDVVSGCTEGVALEKQGLRARSLLPEWSSRQIVQVGAMLMRKRVFDRVGGFDETLRFAEDMDWCIRARERGVAVHFHDDTVLLYRRHGDNVTNDVDARDRAFVQVLKKTLDRKRARGATRDPAEEAAWPTA